MAVLAPAPEINLLDTEASLSTTTPRKVPSASESTSYLERNVSRDIKLAIASELQHKTIFYDNFLSDHFSDARLDELLASVPLLRLPDNTDWVGFPSKRALEERKYDPLVYIMNGLSKPSSYLFVNHHKHALKSVEGESLKPDIIAVSALKRSGKYEWEDVDMVGEVKRLDDYSTTVASTVQLAMYAREVLRHQYNRRFVYGFTLCGDLLQVWLFDRSGAVGSAPFDMRLSSGVIPFTRFVNGFSHKTKEQIGYDLTMTKTSNVWVVDVSDQAGNIKKCRIVRELSVNRANAIVSRATRVWVVEFEGKEWAVKDCWRDERLIPEGSWYDHLSKMGVEGIPKCLAWSVVKTSENVDDTTVTARSGITDFKAYDMHATRKSSLFSSSLSIEPPLLCQVGPMPITRIHTRQLTDLVGIGLENFTSLLHLVKILIAVVKQISAYCKASALHRDISVGNILITEDSSGFVHDFDQMTSCDPNTGKAYGERRRGKLDPRQPVTGTAAFMAVDVLAAAGRIDATLCHSFAHDLESVFWLICWVSIHWQGPGLPRRCALDDPDDEDHPRLSAMEGVWTAENPVLASKQKQAILVTETEFNEMEDMFAPYFQRLKPTARDLRNSVAQPLNDDAPRMAADFLEVLSRAEVELDKAVQEEIQLYENAMAQHNALQPILAGKIAAAEALRKAQEEARKAERKGRKQEQAVSMASLMADFKSVGFK